MLLCALQLVSEFCVDAACTFKELKVGIPILAIWSQRNLGWVLREFIQMLEAACILLMVYHVVAYPIFCKSATDVCSCSYARQLPAVAAHCFPGELAAEAGRASAGRCLADACAANVTSCLPECRP